MAFVAASRAILSLAAVAAGLGTRCAPVVRSGRGVISKDTLPFARIPLSMRDASPTALFSSDAGALKEKDALVPPAPPLHDAVVCGGGPAGLLAAIMLARDCACRVTLYERLPPPPSPDDGALWSDVAKFYLIGLGERGQAALREFGAWDDVARRCTAVPGRMDWAPDAGPDSGVERIFTDRPVMTQVLPRDKLVGVLHEHILRHYMGRIDLEYEKEATPVDFDHEGGAAVLLRVAECQTKFLRDTPSNAAMQNAPAEGLCDIEGSQLVAAKLLVAADGTQRNVANRMEEADREKRDAMSVLGKWRYGPAFHVKRYVDDNQRVYKTIPFRVPDKWRKDLNFSARSKDGRILFDSLPADGDGNQCAALLLKREDALAQERSDPAALRRALDAVLPQFSALLDDAVVARVAQKPPSFLPSFRYVAPRLHQGERTVLLGDAIHTVKPYFGLGANSALEDVQILKQAIASTETIKDATRQFSERRARESKALVQISRELDRPGLQGAFTFVLPLVLDSIFHKAAPRIFSPNTIAMLQKRDTSFRGLRRRKRWERLGQAATLGTLCAGATLVARQLIRALSRATGQRNTLVAAALAGGLAAIAAAQRAAVFLVPGLAPADVLNKASQDTGEGAEKLATA